MTVIEQFVNQVIESGTYEEMDRFYVANKFRGFVGDDDQLRTDQSVKDQLISLAIINQKIDDSVTAKEILNDQLMDLVTPTPAALNRQFQAKYAESPQAATNFFYEFCKANDYIKVAAIKKNVEFSNETKYGDLEITINLSKPEKDPKMIAAASTSKDVKYPMCQLCMENEGYLGRLGYPARSNHRVIRINVGDEEWGMQYSPYAYFNEHCIFLDSVHEPMKINRQTITNLIDIENQFPEYFVGSNADLPIVGGSMLAHEHYQGGKHIFPMMKADLKQKLEFPKFDHVKAGIVNWPMSDIRLESTDTNQLVDLAEQIMNNWKQYSDDSVSINAYGGETSHHTVTPIMHRDGDTFILDLVLRDNGTSTEFPNGIFHPHDEVAHIKKENIGLIEVMGRAILPARLLTEMQEVKRFWLNEDNQIEAIHLVWAKAVQAQQTITAKNVDEILHQELATVFAQVLENAGVFKDDAQGKLAWNRFIEQL